MSQQLSLFRSNGIFNPKISVESKIYLDNLLKPDTEKATVKVAKQVERSLTLIPTLSIHPTKICQFSETVWKPSKPVKKSNVCQQLDSKITFEHLLKSSRSAQGNVSDIARRKMGKAIEYLLFLSNPKSATSQLTGRLFNFRIAFITLTLPSKQKHSDNEIKQKLLNSFLLELKQYYKVKNYVWRAEKQLNGNIHFHIIVDKFIPWSELRNRWNRITNKLGYVDNYRNEMRKFHKGEFKVREDLLKRWSYKSQINAYKTGVANDWQSPNSTDVHSIKKIKNIQNYITKYLTKNEEQENRNKIEYRLLELTETLKELKGNSRRKTLRKIKKLKYLQKKLKKKIQQGRIWGCNQSLSNPTGARLIVDSEVSAELNELLEKTDCDIYDADYFSVFSISFKDLVRNKKGAIFKAFVSYMSKEFGYQFQSEFFIK